MPIPENAEAIYTFLTSNGYSPNAAAGILGNIEQESGGNPAEPGGGLIQILAGGPGYTSNTSLAAQEQSILNYNNAQGSALIAQLNAASSPTDAATIYSDSFERPGIPDLANRIASAVAVAAAAASGNWQTGAGATQPPSAVTQAAYSTLGVGSILDSAQELLKDVAVVLDYVFGMFGKGQGMRIVFTIGAIAALLGAYKVLAPGGGPSIPKVVPV